MFTNAIEMGFESIMCHREKSIFEIIVIIVVTLLLAFSFTLWFAENYSYSSIDHLLRNGISNTGVVRILDMDNTNFDAGQTLLNTLVAQDEICSAGRVSLGATTGLDELFQLRDGNNELIYISSTAFDLCKIDIREGKSPDELNIDFNDKKVNVYLGYDYINHINLNDTFYDDNGVSYKVIGFFEKGSKFLNQGVGLQIDTQRFDYAVSLDTSIVVVEECLSSDTFIFSFNAGSSFEDVKDIIRNAAKNAGYVVSIQELKDIYKLSNSEYEVMKVYVGRILVVVLLSSILVISCTQIENVLSSKRKNGIFYALGYSQESIGLSILIEAVIKFLVSIIFSLPLSYLWSKIWLETGEQISLLNELYFLKIMPITIAIVLISILIAISIPIFIFVRYTPVDLLRGD